MEKENTITKDTTKEKIILFVIGVLTGAVISTSAFFAYIKLAGIGTTSNNHSMQMPGGTPPKMPSGNQGGTPPEMPSDNNSSNTNNQNGTSSSKSNKTNQSTANN